MAVVQIVRDGGIVLFCLLACLFAVAGTLSLFRLPDAYTRLHGACLGSTAASFSAFLSALIASSGWDSAGRVLLLIIFFFISCPTTTHIIARYAWYSGLDPWAPPRQPHKSRPVKNRPERPAKDQGRGE
ncbi:MAG: monovalent cation/H(+) antiporter subunit G [Treponema sp.]|jgi:monovalent cation/proton antiporter MnhG/PhaG subunit|nr:monovalent cation/H(+) antiporter subunit G [Treponema sp.]